MAVKDSTCPEDKTPQLAAHEVHFAYGARSVLRGTSLTVGPGEIVSVLGANGSGKTTLLRVLLGLARPRAGCVTLNGKPLARYAPRERARCLAYVPQSHTMPFPYTVLEIAVLGRLPHTGLIHPPTRRDHDVALETLDRLGIASLARRPYAEISGGERQLALIARALTQGARILVMDEPVSGLDYGNQLRFLQHLRRLAADGYAILKATHHPEHALLASTRVILLCDGVVAGDGPPGEAVTSATIRRLYAVDVVAFHAPNGRATAFYPCEPLYANPPTPPDAQTPPPE